MATCAWKKMLCAGMVGAALFSANGCEAGVVTGYVPMLTYADHTVPTYSRPGGKRVGIISPNVALVHIREIRPDGWARGTYPIANGKRVERWFQMQELQGYWDFKNYTLQLEGDRIVYRTSEQAGKTGTLLNRQKMLVVGEEGDNLKVIYRVNGGSEYKMGWISKTGKSGSDEPEPEPEPNNNNTNVPVINITIENNPTIQNEVNVSSTNTNTNTSTNTNTNENNNQNTNENNNQNSNSNQNQNTNNNTNKNH